MQKLFRQDDNRELLHLREFTRPGVADCVLVGLARSTVGAWAIPEDEGRRDLPAVLRLWSWMRLLAERGGVAQNGTAEAEAPPTTVPSDLWMCDRTLPDATTPPWRALKRRRVQSAPARQEGAAETIVVPVRHYDEAPLRPARQEGAAETLLMPARGCSGEDLRKEDRESVEVLRQLLEGAEPLHRSCAS